MSTNLHIGVDMFGIATAISSVFHDDQDRSAFVKNSHGVHFLRSRPTVQCDGF